MIERGDFHIDDPVLEPGPMLPDEAGLDSGAPGAAPFALSGRRAYVTGKPGENTRNVWIHPGFEVQLAISPSARASAQQRAGLRRVLENGAIEQNLVPLELPAVLCQWSAPDQRADIFVEGVISGPDSVGRCEWNHTDRTLEMGGDDDQLFMLAFSRCVEWTIDVVPEGRTTHLRFRASIAIDSQEDVMFAIAAGYNAAELARTFDRLRRPRLLASARRTTALQLDVQQLGIDTPDPAINRALRWAAHHAGNVLIDAPARGRTTIPDYDAASIALTLLALGDAANARGVLQYLGGAEPAPREIPLYLLLAARYTASTADLDFVHGEWPRIVAAFQRGINAGLGNDAVMKLALRELADAAASLGAEPLRAPVGAQTERPLADEPGWPDWVGFAGGRGAASQIAGWFRSLDEATPYSIAAFVHGLLGFEPDAPKNRARIRPAIPAEWAALEVRNLPIGDARIELRFERTDQHYTFRLKQNAGGIPIRAVFEPIIPGLSVHEILLDGRPAQLDVRRSENGLTVPVQLDLDYERVLEVTTGG